MAKKYRVEAILKSKEFEEIQKDFLRALLPKEEYTLAEVRKIIEAYFRKDVK